MKKNTNNAVMMLVVVAIIGTTLMMMLDYIFGTTVVFVGGAIIVFIYGAIIVPFKQFKKSYKEAVNSDKQKSFSIDHYVVYAKTQEEAEEKVRQIKNSFERKKAKRRTLNLSNPNSN